LHDGKVVPDCHWWTSAREVEFNECGQLDENANILDIWNGPVYQEIRDRIQKGQILPQCRGCGLAGGVVDESRTAETDHTNPDQEKVLLCGIEEPVEMVQLDISKINRKNRVSQLSDTPSLSAIMKEAGITDFVSKREYIYEVATGFFARGPETAPFYQLELFLHLYDFGQPVVIYDCSPNKIWLQDFLAKGKYGSNIRVVNSDAPTDGPLDAPIWDKSIAECKSKYLFMSHLDNFIIDSNAIDVYIEKIERSGCCIVGHQDYAPHSAHRLSIPRISTVCYLVDPEKWRTLNVLWDNAHMLNKQPHLEVVRAYEHDVGAVLSAKIMELQLKQDNPIVYLVDDQFINQSFQHYWATGGVDNRDITQLYSEEKKKAVSQNWEHFCDLYEKVLKKKVLIRGNVIWN